MLQVFAMGDQVHEIFKSFVNSKLKQLGMNGSKSHSRSRSTSPSNTSRNCSKSKTPSPPKECEKKPPNSHKSRSPSIERSKLSGSRNSRSKSRSNSRKRSKKSSSRHKSRSKSPTKKRKKRSKRDSYRSRSRSRSRKRKKKSRSLHKSRSRSKSRKRSKKSKSPQKSRSRSKSRKRSKKSRSPQKSRSRSKSRKYNKKSSSPHKSRSRSRSRKRSKKSRSRSRKRSKKSSSRHRSKSRSRSRKRSKKSSSRHRSKSRSRSRKRSKKSSSRHRSRSRSRSAKRSKRSRSRHKSKSPRRHRHHHHHHHHHHKSSDSRNSSRHKGSSRRRRSSSPVITSVDKVRLLEIAKANVLAQHKADITVSNLSHESKALLRSGGVTLQQLTGVCQDIAEGKRDVLADSAAVQTKDAAVALTSKVHHPFQVREAPSIAINIKNQMALLPPPPAKPINELTKEFPVSCGSQHQHKEVLEEVYGKWEPIVKDKAAKSDLKAIIEEKVFPDSPPEAPKLTIKEVIAQRVSAARELQSNPNDVKAMKSMVESQQKLDSWTTAKQIPGRFTGATGLQPLKRRDLERGHQAWASNNTFNSGKQVVGIGKSLLQKMGWKEGESLGKTNAGMLEPLKVQVKTDRKGLSSVMEMPVTSTPQPRRTGGQVVLKDLSGKHPVSALMEICSKRRWKPPNFNLVQHTGPDHHRAFLFKVIVNDTAYQPAVASANKKQAKSQAAAAALQAMGLIPT